jgi:hypothetical protein
VSHPDLITIADVLGNGGPPVSGGGERGAEVYTVVPSASAPRLLVPFGQRRVAAAAVRHTIVATSRQARARQQVLAGVFALGIGRRSVGDLVFRHRVAVDSTALLSAHLSERLGATVFVSVRFGPQRANRKPVLQLLDSAGRCVAFAKMSVDDFTGQLVRAETDALRELDGRELGPVRAPRVLHAGPWGAATLLVVEALPVWAGSSGDPQRTARLRLAAMRAVAGSAGINRATVDASRYAVVLTERIEALGDHPLAGPLRDGIATAMAHPRPIDFGAWHGDWNGGNMAVRDDDVLLWDWERYAVGVPVGFDALHYELYRRVANGTTPAVAAADIAASSAVLLEPFGIDPIDAGIVWTLYATDIATRFVTDKQELGTTRLGQVGDWIGAALAGKPTAAQRSSR